MDAESFKPLISILIWGGLFFVMMRFGCGAHMMGGHGAHGHDKPGQGLGAENKDPVCGMTIELQKSTAASTYRGKTYHFCSTSCRDKFDREPEKYVSASPARLPESEGPHHG